MFGRWPLRRWFRLLWCLLALACLAILPYIIIEFKKAQFSIHYQAWVIAGIFVLLAVPVSIYEVAMQLEYFSRPKLQIRVIRILWMVPIYALDAWLALRFESAQIYLDTIRECYEAFVIYSFFMYLLAYLEDEYGDISVYLSTKEEVPHMWGVQWLLKPWRMGDDFMWQSKKGVLGYVILRPLMTAVGFVASLIGVYGDGELRFDRVYLYTTIVSNISQAWALYCLVLFYQGTKYELAPIRPVSKFLCVKAVVFLTYWQGVAIAILSWSGVLQTGEWTTYDADDIAAGLQEFLICVEMFFAALAHAFSFPPRDYMDPAGTVPKGFKRNIRIMFDVTDVVDDVQGVVDDTVLQTNKRISKAGQTVWTHTKRQTDRALGPPKALLKRLHRGSQEMADDSDEDVEGRSLPDYRPPSSDDVSALEKSGKPQGDNGVR
ncbi:g10272 [Coccomyxa viridis]|uniref:G10272 protein n=1 Tax=Coccomyxa viridis TaxID=1274662 RepID=A0ABP1G4X7_9CHLO